MLKKITCCFACCLSLSSYAQTDRISDVFSKAMEIPAEKKGKELFKGQIHKGKRNGMGVLVSPDGTVYVGDFSGGSINGFGMQIASTFIDNCDSCFAYVGNWLNGKKSGSGICYARNGDVIYKGLFGADKPAQNYPAAEQDYKRYFSVIEFENGDVYIGEMANGNLDGFGTIVSHNGDMWQGRFKAGQCNGIGLYTAYDTEWKTLNFTDNEMVSVVSSSETYEQIDIERKSNRRKAMTAALNDMFDVMQKSLSLVKEVKAVRQSEVSEQPDVGNSYNGSNSGTQVGRQNAVRNAGHNPGEVQAMQTDRRTYSSYESQLIKMNTYWETQYNDERRKSIQQNMRKIRTKWESRGFSMFHSQWEDWDGRKK